mgnify:CR=1 FL=1
MMFGQHRAEDCRKEIRKKALETKTIKFQNLNLLDPDEYYKSKISNNELSKKFGIIDDIQTKRVVEKTEK